MKAGNNLRVDLKFTNFGYSSLFVKHPVYAVLTDANGNVLPASQFAPVRLDLDLTQIAPGKTVNATTSLYIPPALVSTPNVKLALWMPDPDPVLSHDHRYNYLLDNGSAPDPTTGLNFLFALTIK